MNYSILNSENSARTEVKGSRFIGSAFFTDNREEADNKLKLVREKYQDATHNCWAYRILKGGMEDARFSDDGEPSGTAGRPILETLRERNAGDLLLVVTRYFGGIKLGMGGLGRAYRECARHTIDACGLREVVEYEALKLRFPYNREALLKNLLNQFNGKLDSCDYREDIRWNVKTPLDTISDFILSAQDICRGDIEIIQRQREGADGQ